MRERAEAFVVRYANWVIDHHWRVAAMCFVFLILAGAGLTHLTMTADYRVFFSQEDPRLRAFEAFETSYTRMDTIVFVVKPADDDIFTNNALTILQTLTENSWQIPHAMRVDSVTNFQHSRAQGDDLIVSDLVEDPAALSPVEMDAIGAVALAEPVLKGRLVSNTGAAAGIIVTLQLPGEDHTLHVPESVQAARAIAADMEASHPNTQIALTGMALMSYAQMELIGEDMLTLIPLMFGIILLLLVLLRSFLGMIASLVMIIFSVLPATGIMGWLGMQLNQASASAPIIIMTLAIADCVHILITTFQNMGEGQTKKQALIESLRINAQPVFLTSLTTGIGFLSLNFSDTQPFRELGNFTAVGVLIAWIMSMTLLPALVAAMPVSPKRLSFGTYAMRRLADIVVLHSHKLLWIVGIAAMLVTLTIPTLEIEDRYVEWFDQSTSFRQDTDFATENLVGPYVMEFSLSSGAPGGIADVAYLERLESFMQWLKAQAEVVHVTGLTDIMKRLNRSMHGDNPDWYRLPDSRELAAQYMLLYEMSLPYGLDLNSQVNFDKSASRVTVNLATVTSNQMRELADRTEAWLAGNTPAAMHSRPTGIALIFAHIGQRNIESMLWGTAVAFVIISFIIAIALRDVRLGLISLFSNSLPVLITFGLWAIFVGEIGIIASVITSTSLGLIVDDTVHFLSKYRRAKQEHRINTHDAVRFSFDHVGNALWITTTILVAGFSVLALSVFALNVQLGVLTAMTLASALILDFFLLPPLIMWLDKQKSCICRTCQASYSLANGTIQHTARSISKER